MLIARPEYFTNPDSKEKWLTALNNKILQVREEIITAKANEVDKLSKIA
ncbi:11392_t:CDS:1, partial [Funneliformis geosporum]